MNTRCDMSMGVLKYAIGALLSLACLSCGSGQSSVPGAGPPPAPTMVGVWQGSVCNSLFDPGACYPATIIITEEGPAKGTDTPFKGTYVTAEPGTSCSSQGMQSGTVTGRLSSVPLDWLGDNIEATFTDQASPVEPLKGLGLISLELGMWTGKWDVEWALRAECGYYQVYEHWFNLRKTS